MRADASSAHRGTRAPSDRPRIPPRTVLCLLAAVLALGGCASPEVKEPGPEDTAALGEMTTVVASTAMQGVVVAVPHAELAPRATAAARALQASAGTGLVVAQGYQQAHAIAVNVPVEGRTARFGEQKSTPRARAVYERYVGEVRRAGGGAMGLYIELREAGASGGGLQVATVGVSLKEAAALKALRAPGTGVRVEPADKLTYDPWGTRHAGVLLLPPKGLSIALPQSPGGASAQETARWLNEAVRALRPVGTETAAREKVLDRGRFTLVRRPGGIVVSAPHGSGDTYSDVVAQRIAERMNASLIVVHGFMGTQSQGGEDRRIAVNRPLEGPGIHTQDRPSANAEIVYRAYVDNVRSLAAWPPALYIEVHCNAHPATRGVIEVAGVGLGVADARRIKAIYQQVAERALGRPPEVSLRIEGLDQIVMNGHGNKVAGILGRLPKGLHVEFPLHEVMRDPAALAAYGDIMAEVLRQSAAFLTKS